jgi:hypothetical protein
MKHLTLAVFFALLIFTTSGFGQATDANLVGTIVDATGAVVPNAAVELTNEATGVKSSAKTDANGFYRFNNMPIGRYDVTASAPGFATATVKGLDLELNKNVTSNITLQVGTVSATVDVAEAAATIDTSTAQLQSTFEARQISNLPIIESANGFYGALNLSLLSSGVASNGGVGQGTGPSVGGQRPVENNYTIEGVDNNNKGVTGPLVYVPTDATAEFTLLTNQYGAEFGHSTGGQFNTVIKSGSNQLHGSLYEYFQNRNLNALDAIFANQGFTSTPRYDQNKLGMTIGGPIIKDKLFFFGSAEYAPLGLAATATPVSSPTAAGFAALNGLSGISQSNLKALQQYLPPAPSANDVTYVCPGVDSAACSDLKQAVPNRVSVPIGTLPIAGPNFNNFYSALGSIDYNPSEKDQVRGRFIYNKSTSFDTSANLPAFWTPLPQRWYLITISDVHTFSPSLTSETRLGFNRFTQYYVVPSFNFPGLDSFPNIVFDNDLGISVGPGAGPQFTVQNTYQLVQNFNWTKGKHTLKFGFDGRDSISPQFFVQRVRGEYDYSDLSEYLNDFVPADLAERNLGNTPYYGNQWATYLYGTDQIRLKTNLTLNLGLRWERTTMAETNKLQTLNAAASVPGLLVFGEPKVQNKNFAPRIGLAWSPGTRGNTSIRAGFGMGYDVIYDNVGLTAYPPQLSPTIDAVNDPVKYHAPFLANGAIKANDLVVSTDISAADARAATSAYIPDQKLPYSIQWNVGVQHVFHNDYTLEVRYLGTRGVHLLVQQQINKQNTPVTPTRGLPTYLQAPSQGVLDSLPLTLAQLQAIDARQPEYAAAGFNSSITAFMPIGNSLYHGLATQLTRRFAHGLQFVGAYTWSHNIDDSTASHFSTVLTPRREQDFGNLRIDRSNSALDRRQRLTLSWLWETPWMNHSNSWFAKNVVGNWRVVGTYTAETGELATAQSIVDSNLNGDTAGDRTIINPSGNPLLGSDVTTLTNSKGAIVGYAAINPNAMYIRARAGAFPNGGRNTLQMPGINNFDLSLGKRFTIREGKTLEFRADASNAFNHPQFTPGAINSVKLTSYATGDRTYLGPQDSNFQAWNQVFPSNARTMQLALKFVF